MFYTLAATAFEGTQYRPVCPNVRSKSRLTARVTLLSLEGALVKEVPMPIPGPLPFKGLSVLCQRTRSVESIKPPPPVCWHAVTPAGRKICL